MGGAYSKPAEVQSKFFPEFRASLPRLEGKVIAITGCTSGTGYICAKTCLELGARVIMLNRASSRAEAALQSLKDAVPNAQVELVACDLMSFEKVTQAATELNTKLAGVGIDVLCNNAGIMATPDEATVDGCDTQMQTNHLSHFLLTSLVWPLLEHAASTRGEARVVNHSSGARVYGPKLDEKYLGKNGGNLGGNQGGWILPFQGPRWIRYQQTKLANLVFTYALRERQSTVKACCAHPGLSATNLQVTSSDAGGMGSGFTNFLMSYFSQSAEDGTMPLLRACLDPDAKSGDFFGPLGMTGKAELMPPEKEKERADKASQEMLWRVSKEITGAKFPFEV